MKHINGYLQNQLHNLQFPSVEVALWKGRQKYALSLKNSNKTFLEMLILEKEKLFTLSVVSTSVLIFQLMTHFHAWSKV